MQEKGLILDQFLLESNSMEDNIKLTPHLRSLARLATAGLPLFEYLYVDDVSSEERLMESLEFLRGSCMDHRHVVDKVARVIDEDQLDEVW